MTEFKIEILVFIVAAGLLLDFIFKTSKVKETAVTVAEKFKDCLSREFSLVTPLTTNSRHEFFLYSSGRNGLDSCLISLIFKQTSLAPPVSANVLRDTLRIQVTLRRNDLGVFALFLKKNSLDKKKRWDLDQMTSVLSFSDLKKEKYTVFGDNLQVLSLVLQDLEIKEFLLQQEFLQEIICSDSTDKKPVRMQDIKKDRQNVIFTFTLKDYTQDEIEKIMDFVLKVVDVLSLMELSKDTIEKINRAKVIAEESVLKSNEEEIKSTLFKRKVLERKKREEARMNLSKEEARKAEEKEKKRELKKSQKKMMKKGKVVMR